MTSPSSKGRPLTLKTLFAAAESRRHQARTYEVPSEQNFFVPGKTRGLAKLALVCLAAITLESATAMETKTAVHPIPRRLVLCLDGTWNNPYDEQERVDRTPHGDKQPPRKAPERVIKPSNPLKLCRAVLPYDGTGRYQITYYHTGIGSLSEYPGRANRLLHLTDRLLGGVWGAGFEANVEEAVHFLVLNYEPGDEVFVFGFSRGAATARGLTRFLEWNNGIPQKEDAYFLPRLFQGFVASHGKPEAKQQNIADINKELLNDGKAELQPFHPVTITYLGVWDTVMALGSRFEATGKSTAEAGWTFYAGATPAACVRHARQALAIDEHRYDFRPEIWTHASPDQRMEQRWFAGAHSNVGGGYAHDGLANIAFHWILEGATDEGLKIDPEYIRYFKPYPLDSLYDSSSLLYRIGDTLRLRSGKGRRTLDQPGAANLTLDGSVIKRIRATSHDLQPPKPGQTAAPYRPQNVLEFLACQQDLITYLAGIGINDLAEHPLPDDVQQRIAALRPRCRKNSE